MMIKINKSKVVSCHSKHPFEPWNVQDVNKLIIGTIPPHRFCIDPKKLYCGDTDWYYGSKDNYFWDILKDACFPNKNLCDLENRKKCLENNSIGLFDMILECDRENNCGSSDNDLFNIEPIDACKIIQENKNKDIELFFTSVFAADLFRRQTKCDQIALRAAASDSINCCDKKINYTILYSPSPSWARGLDEIIRKDPDRNQIRIEQYKKICGNVYC